MSTAALIVAAGKSDRLAGEIPKQFRSIAGKPILAWTLSRFDMARSIDDIVVVTSEEWLGHVQSEIVERYGIRKVNKIVSGGETRADSVRNGLHALPAHAQFVAIHDAARPLVTPDDIDRVVACAQKSGAALLAISVADTVKVAEGSTVRETVPRQSLYLAQTPQVFRTELIRTAHDRRLTDSRLQMVTDDCALVEGNGCRVEIVEPGGPNFKLTTPRDLVVIEAMLNQEADAR